LQCVADEDEQLEKKSSINGTKRKKLLSVLPSIDEESREHDKKHESKCAAERKENDFVN
jgi:peroxiredoxin